MATAKNGESKNNGGIDYRGCYGDKCKPSEIKNWLLEAMKDNFGRKNRFTLNIWGAPGGGKTSLVKSLQHEKVLFNGKEFNGVEVIDIPLAQIEEMGDVLGLPETFVEMEKDGEKKMIMRDYFSSYEKAGWLPTNTRPKTLYAPPSWVPTEAKPGIILFDDGNRASQRIMKGLMQLVQDYRTISWEIPEGWTIVFTGNPDNRFNQVTSMDTAQLTRMKHITFQVDAKEWALWATENKLDPRGINFILRYPEMIVGSERTNPRTLAELFYVLKKYKNFEGDNYRKAICDANSLLDEETVTTMFVFFKRDVEMVIEPDTILKDYDKASEELAKLMKKAEPRIDIVSIVNDRLVAHLCSENYEFDKAHIKNVQNWILDKNLPRDFSYSFIKSILLGGCKYGKDFVAGNMGIAKMVGDSFANKLS